MSFGAPCVAQRVCPMPIVPCKFAPRPKGCCCIDLWSQPAVVFRVGAKYNSSMTKQKIASILLYVVSFVVVGFGLLYIYTGFTKGLMPYHLRFLGIETCDELSPNVCELMKTFVQIIGFSFTAIGIALFLLIK